MPDNTRSFPDLNFILELILDSYDTTVEALLYIEDIDDELYAKYVMLDDFPDKKNRYRIIRQAAGMMPLWSDTFREEPSEKSIFHIIKDSYSSQDAAKLKYMEILDMFQIKKRYQVISINKKINKAISKLPTKIRKISVGISESKLKQMIDECFKITVNLGMLEQEQIDHAVIKFFNKPKAGTLAGIRKKKIYMQFNFQRSGIFSPDEIVDIGGLRGTSLEQLKAIKEAQLKGKWARWEYASFWKDKDIGLWVGNNKNGAWRSLVAHEMSHVVNYNSVDDKWRGRGHKNKFQKVYRILRKKMGN